MKVKVAHVPFAPQCYLCLAVYEYKGRAADMSAVIAQHEHGGCIHSDKNVLIPITVLEVEVLQGEPVDVG